MPFTISYLLKLSASMFVVYLFYRIVLMRLTFYNWNRFYLLSYTVLSFFIPFINITPLLERNAMMQNRIVRFIPPVDVFNGSRKQLTPNAQNLSGHLSLSEWILIVVVTGIFVMLVRLVIQFLSFRRIVSKAEFVSGGDIKLYQV
ncbi:MAG: hypothetical protein ABUT20_52320, partial [Bacteroidota bacterium]